VVTIVKPIITVVGNNITPVTEGSQQDCTIYGLYRNGVCVGVCVGVFVGVFVGVLLGVNDIVGVIVGVTPGVAAGVAVTVLNVNTFELISLHPLHICVILK
jgi:hypothetical protein